MRTIIVDDEELPMKLLQKALTDSGEIERCQTFTDPLAAYEFVKSNPIHVAFLDIGMPGINGLRLSDLLHELDDTIDVVFVTAYDHYAVQAFDMNVLDYLLKPVTAERMARTLEKIKKRRRDRAAGTSIEIHAESPEPGSDHNEILTEQETKVLWLIARGLSNKEIAVHLNITRETVKFHIKNMYRKLDVINRVQALRQARESGILG